MARIVVIIPTYNERANTEAMVPALADVFSRISGHAMLLLYVDANSPDGTAAAVKEAQKRYGWLHLIVEEKKSGLGAAFARGMQYAMKELSADYLMEFDGDFQHDPNLIIKMVGELDKRYDYVVGSRYVKGGKILKGWGLKRRFISWFGSVVIRVLLWNFKIHDWTTGLKLSRVKGFMDSFDFGTLLSKSFAYKVHLFYYMFKKGARIIEMPIDFRPREKGSSKLPNKEIFETLKVVWKLRSMYR